MNKLLIGTLFIFSIGICFAQNVPTAGHGDGRINKYNRVTARQYIFDLKDGVLLFRLKTQKNIINAYREKGLFERADKLELKQLNLNKEIVSNVQNTFNFCPTYFFFSDFSNHVINQQLDSVVFLNANLEPDTSIHITSKKFLTAEFGRLQQQTGESDYYQETTYTGVSTLDNEAFVMMNQKFRQLRSPFPYQGPRVSNYSTESWSNQLYNFYARSIQKLERETLRMERKAKRKAKRAEKKAMRKAK